MCMTKGACLFSYRVVGDWSERRMRWIEARLSVKMVTESLGVWDV